MTTRLCFLMISLAALQGWGAPKKFTKPLASAKHLQTTAMYSVSSPLPNTLPLVEPSPHHWELSLGFPGLIELRLNSEISRNTSMGLGFGFLPISEFLPPSKKEVTQPFSDRFDTLILPKITLTNASLFYQHRWENDWFLEPQLNLLVITGGGEAFLKDPQTQLNSRISEITFRYYQLMGGLSGGYSWRLSRGAGRFELGGGLGYSLFSAVQMEVKGLLPAFLALAPEYQKTFVNDSSALEKDILTTIENSGLIQKFLPTVFMRWSW